MTLIHTSFIFTDLWLHINTFYYILTYTAAPAWPVSPNYAIVNMACIGDTLVSNGYICIHHMHLHLLSLLYQILPFLYVWLVLQKGPALVHNTVLILQFCHKELFHLLMSILSSWRLLSYHCNDRKVLPPNFKPVGLPIKWKFGWKYTTLFHKAKLGQFDLDEINQVGKLPT